MDFSILIKLFQINSNGEKIDISDKIKIKMSSICPSFIADDTRYAMSNLKFIGCTKCDQYFHEGFMKLEKNIWVCGYCSSLIDLSE